MVTTFTLTEYEIERNKPMPSLNHGTIQANLAFEIKLRYNDQYRVVSELSLDLSEWPSVPDISLYPKSAFNPYEDVVAMSEPPLCAIEILSPTQALSDLVAKANNYFSHGVRSCWIVIPVFQNIYVYSGPGEYDIFKINQTLVDANLGISFPVSGVFS